MSTQESLQERAIGTRLNGLASGLDVSSPGWVAIRSEVVRIRRRRRAARAAKVTGGIVAAAALLGSLQVGWVPYPSWAPAAPLSAGPTGLADRPAQGSLARDDAWLDDFRRHLVSLHQPESGGEDWRVPSVGAVDVLYAGDVGSSRVVLIEAPYRWGFFEQRQQAWFQGPAGADPDAMVQLSNDGPANASFTAVGATAGGVGAAPQGLVVVATGDRRVTVQEWGVLGADGSVTRERTNLSTGADGLLEWVAPGQGPYEVDVEGLPSQVVGEVVAQVPVVAWSGRGDEVADEVVRTGVQDAVVGLSLVTAPVELVWAGGRGAGSPVLVSVLAESGARLLVPGRVATPVPWRTPEYEDLPAMRADLVRVLPSGGDLVAAWQVGETVWDKEQNFEIGYADSDEEWFPHQRASATIAFVGPELAASAEVLDGGGGVLRTVPLVDGGGSVEAQEASRVRFLGADGAELGSIEVVPWSAENAVPGPLP